MSDDKHSDSAGPSSDFDADNDSLYAMPLELLPFESSTLSKGRMKMNGALDHGIEIFRGTNGHSGLIMLDEITLKLGMERFGWPGDRDTHPDHELLMKLGNLTSFDVYSLRLLFRRLGITPVRPEALSLSKEARNSLAAHLRRFTAPLILHVFGDEAEIGDTSDPAALLRNPDQASAVRNLNRLAMRLDIPLDAIPNFLQRFSDCYLSISYFERYLHSIFPEVMTIVGEIDALRGMRKFQDNRGFLITAEEVSVDLSNLISSALGKIERFHKETETMWSSMSADSFYEISAMVDTYQMEVAGVLCGLGIKTTEWRARFDTPDTGGPSARAEMLMSNLRPGLEKLKEIDAKIELDESLQLENAV